jgi:DHA2 family multidrug resistance protein
VEHAALAPFASPLNRALPPALSPATPHGAAVLDGLINQQAQIVAYNNDFWLMMVIAVPILLLLPMMRRPRNSGGSGHAVME